MLKKMILATFIVVCMLSQSVFCAELSDDVKNELYDTGIMQGDEGGNLNLDKSITRAEAAKMFCVATGADVENCVEIAFSDVAKDHWAYRYICVMVQSGIMTCDNDKNFNPDGEVTNEDLIKIIVNLLGEGMRTMIYGGDTGYPIVAKELGITADMKFKINDSAKRSDAALMIYRMMDIPIMFVINGYQSGITTACLDGNKNGILINLKGAFIESGDGEYSYNGKKYASISYEKLREMAKEKSLDRFSTNRENFESAKNVIVKMLEENKLIQMYDSSKDNSYYLIVNGVTDENFEKVTAEEKVQLDAFMTTLEDEKFYGVYATKDAIEITLFRGNFHMGVVYSENLPKEYETYAELISLGDNWYYFRTADFEVAHSLM